LIADQPYLLCFGDPDLAARIAHYGLPAALFLVGFAGSLIHCLGMCGPFVLGQVAGRAGLEDRPYGELQRLKEGALIPYHLGRVTTYGGLGAAAGLFGAALFAMPGLRLAAAILLILAALALMAQILPKLATILPANRLAGPLASLVVRLAGKPVRSRLALYRFGLLLGFLPCGFLWGALAAAAASGSAWTGMAAMAAFGLGTAPALIGIGWGGAMFGRGRRSWLRLAALPLQAVNAAFLLWIAARVIDGL
jgi:sulfite exporter TauE/SafE